MTPDEKIRFAKSLLVSRTNLHPFMSNAQRSVLADCLRGEEREGFADMLIALNERIANMPVTYQTDGQGKDAIVHLHYFGGPCDAWITEKDVDGGVEQAFGWANLEGDGMSGAECGYISIKEMVEAGLELDLYWEPKPVREC